MIMKNNTSKTVMKCLGATFAVCSAISMIGGCKTNDSKKAIKKTVNKVADFVDTVATFM